MPKICDVNTDDNANITDAEIAAWLMNLATTDSGRLSVLRELLRWASADDMTPEDRAICRRCLCQLQERIKHAGTRVQGHVARTPSHRVVKRGEGARQGPGTERADTAPV